MKYKNRFRNYGWTLRLQELALAEQSVPAHLRSWFARSCVDYLIWFPFRLTDLLCASIFSLLFFGIGGWLAVAAIVSAFSLFVIWPEYILKRLQKNPNPDFERTLAAYGRFCLARASLFAGLTCVGIATLPGNLMLPLILMHALMLRMSATAFLTLAHKAAVSVLIMAVPVIVMLIYRGDFASMLAASLMMALTGYSLSVVYNQYYLFATRRLRTRTLQDSTATMQMLIDQYVEHGKSWVWETDADGHMIEAPQKFAEMFDTSEERIQGFNVRDVMVDSPEARFIFAAGDRQEAYHDLPCPIKVGSITRWISVSARPQFDRDGAFTGYKGVSSDISDQMEAEQRADFLAHYDTLTALPNRVLFNQTLDRILSELGEEGSAALCYVDLIQFKEVNDTYGHLVGDSILRMTARRLEAVGGESAVVSRLNGDEFAVLITDVHSLQSMSDLADAISRKMSEPVEMNGAKLSIGVNVGVAFGPRDGETAEDLMRAADIALHNAKRRGRGCISFFQKAMQRELEDRRQLEADLRQALEDGMLELHYQPIVDSRSGNIASYEALMRWHHSDRGPISPEKFIGLAEETGLIVPLGEWVIREALDEAANWPDDINIAINLSPIQLRSERLLPTIVNALSHSGVDAGRVEVEITESVLLDHSQENIAALHKLHDLGIRIALDDFGTGYSSLNYLRRFPFDKIKIDRCFVDDIVNTPEDIAIVDAVLAIAAGLKMIVTAEGVETAEQLATLRDHGCDQVQGYYYSAALPAGQLDHGARKTKGGSSRDRPGKFVKLAGKKAKSKELAREAEDSTPRKRA